MDTSLPLPQGTTGNEHAAIRLNWWILGGSLGFVIFTLVMGLKQVPFNQEIIFAGSMAIVLFLMEKLVKELQPSARRMLVGKAIVPYWQFTCPVWDGHFPVLYVGEVNIFVVGFLTVAGSLLSLPIIGMFYGLHDWTSGFTHGVVDARFIAVVDTALESPLGQVAMIPMLTILVVRSNRSSLRSH